MNDFLTYLIAAAFLQNIVLTVGFGTSLTLKIVRRPGDILYFGGLLSFFTLITVLIFYPLDNMMGVSPTAKLLRPLVLLLIAAVLYTVVALVVKQWLPGLYSRIKRLLPMAVFNNVTVGTGLIINHRINLPLSGAVGLALGTSAGFLLICWLMTEGIDRMGHTDVPPSFRGSPVKLLYLAILALALLGFSSEKI
ncbi:MAG: hypothetical protein FWE80_02095, partial [Oscillospiraceae bacterium]|nr:hypothetical protein [Oscillospiraceae bacterium]